MGAAEIKRREPDFRRIVVFMPALQLIAQT